MNVVIRYGGHVDPRVLCPAAKRLHMHSELSNCRPLYILGASQFSFLFELHSICRISRFLIRHDPLDDQLGSTVTELNDHTTHITIRYSGID